MTVKSRVRVSLADEVYDQLKRDMANFVLIPGDRFSENEICERLDVSRTPVRQALVRLQQEGQVEVLFRNGWRMLPFDFHRFDQLYDLRVLIETESVQRLCDGRLMGDTSLATELLDQLAAIWLVPKSRRSADGEQVCEWDERFHCMLVEATGNAELSRVHRDITDRIRVIRKLDFTRRPRIEATYDEHAQILRAILSKRSEQSRLLLKAHIESSQLEVRKITLHQLQLARSQALKPPASD
jgi:DNA-binding GntR family transcriptional regulator